MLLMIHIYHYACGQSWLDFLLWIFDALNLFIHIKLLQYTQLIYNTLPQSYLSRRKDIFSLLINIGNVLSLSFAIFTNRKILVRAVPCCIHSSLSTWVYNITPRGTIRESSDLPRSGNTYVLKHYHK